MPNQNNDAAKTTPFLEGNQSTSESNASQNNPLLSVKTANPLIRCINFSDESKKEKKEKNDD